MKQLWIRFKSKSPKWAKKSQLLFGSLAAMGVSVVSLEWTPDWAQEIAEKLIFVGGGIAAFSQFVISNISKNAEKVNKD